MAEPFSISNPSKSTRRSGMYSMGGVNGRRQDVAPQPQPQPISTPGSIPQHKNSSASTAAISLKRCCCGSLLRVEVAALLIAIIELCFIVYQTFFASLAYDKTGDENAFAFTLTLFSFVLAIIAVILLLIGVHRRSPYFLVPHLLMQFTVFATAFALCIYFVLLLIGGTSVTVDTIFYEDSTRGELGLANAARIEPFQAKIVAHGLNTILISLLIATLIFFFAQVWFFVIVKKCYNIFYHLSVEKKSMIMINAATAAATAPTTTKSSTSSITTPASITTTTDFIPPRHQQQHHFNNNNNTNNSENGFNERFAGNLR